MEPPVTLSIVVATRNCAKELPDCLESIFSQTETSFEVIVQDCLSTDGTVEVLKAHQDSLAYWESAQDSGIYDAWNRAIGHSKGKWVLFIGADDRFSGLDTLRQAVSLLESDAFKEKELVYCKIDIVSDKGEVVDTWGRPPGRVAWQLRHGMPYHLAHSGMFHRRSLFEAVGGFDPELSIAGDYDMILRATLRNPDALGFLPDVTLLLKGDDGVSRSNAHIGIWETMLARRKRGVRGVTPLWALIWFRAILRYTLKKLLRIR